MKVCWAQDLESLMSQSLAVASHAPEMNLRRGRRRGMAGGWATQHMRVDWRCALLCARCSQHVTYDPRFFSSPETRSSNTCALLTMPRARHTLHCITRCDVVRPDAAQGMCAHLLRGPEGSPAMEILMTSPLWSEKLEIWLPESQSQSMQLRGEADGS